MGLGSSLRLWGTIQQSPVLKPIRRGKHSCKHGAVAWENPYAERVNGTIKNEYLKRWTIKDFNALVRKTNKYQILANFDHSPFGNHNNPNSKYQDFKDGILAWKAFTEHFDKMGN